MKTYYHPDFLKYKHALHSESPERLKGILKKVKTLLPKKYGEEILLLAHTQEHINHIKSGALIDRDTPNNPGMHAIALKSAECAITAAENNGFSLARPPGHHAGPDYAMGFCYYNNIAIAAKYLKKNVLIIDLDVHHGNGTQDIIKNDEKIHYLGLHQNPAYPGTGITSELNYSNYPLQLGTTGKEYLKILTHALDKLKFKPEHVGISIGFDTYYKENLASLNLMLEDYEKIGKLLSERLENVFCVLEGGYYIQDLPLMFENFTKHFI
ncbi:MAG: histone deacetylase [Nanoarchaeota archaeon]|nr:histone deacetylase [Nanoarchaeota archaeon]